MDLELLDEEEDMGDVLDWMEKLPSLSLNRNSRCLCGSGKKYKKCCLQKDEGFSFEEFTITTGPLKEEDVGCQTLNMAKEDEEIIEQLYYEVHVTNWGQGFYPTSSCVFLCRL